MSPKTEDKPPMSANKEGIHTRILLCLERDRCYTDKEMSMEKMSRLVGTNTSYLSNVVNKEFGCRFKELINRYRTEMAQREILRQDDATYATGEKCGFTSRANYYEVFRRITGLTPYQYLRTARK